MMRLRDLIRTEQTAGDAEGGIVARMGCWRLQPAKANSTAEPFWLTRTEGSRGSAANASWSGCRADRRRGYGADRRSRC